MFADSADPELIDACLNGNAEAWEVLVQRYKRLVFSIPRKWNLAPEDAAEVFQSVWLDCYRDLPSLRNLDRLQPWLIRVAVRKSHTLSRETRMVSNIPLESPAARAALSENLHVALIKRLELEQLTRLAVNKLSPRCQDVIRALFFEDPLPSYAALAARLGLSGNSIGFTRDRCLERLGSILEDLGYEP